MLRVKEKTDCLQEGESSQSFADFLEANVCDLTSVNHSVKSYHEAIIPRKVQTDVF